MSSARGETLFAVGLSGIGLIALAMVWPDIMGNNPATVGPGFVPAMIAGALAALGAVLAFNTAIQNRNAPTQTTTSETNSKRRNEIVRLASCFAIGLGYIVAFRHFGYFVSTAAALLAMLILFGNKGARTLIARSIIGATVYYIAFVRLLNIYDPNDLVLSLIHISEPTRLVHSSRMPSSA